MHIHIHTNDKSPIIGSTTNSLTTQEFRFMTQPFWLLRLSSFFEKSNFYCTSKDKQWHQTSYNQRIICFLYI